MTPKEKARSLFNLFNHPEITWTNDVGDNMRYHIAKDHALKCCDEIRDGGCVITDDISESFDKYIFWGEVKEEIRKL